MKDIISNIYSTIKDTNNLVEMEEKTQVLMYELFTTLIEDIFSDLNRAIVKQRIMEGWKIETTDSRTVQFMFGAVTFDHTLMENTRGKMVYPLDEWMGFRKRQRYSPLVELKVAEMASESTYRQVAKILKEWLPVTLSHQTVGNMVRTVGKAQADTDMEMVVEIQDAACPPDGKELDFFYADADGVFIRGLREKQGIELHHAVMHEGWEKNGK